MHVRLFIVGLVPVLCIILKVFSARKLLIPLMLICTLLFLPARYGLEGHYGQIYSSELAGIRFFTYHSGPVEPWFFYRVGDVGVLGFYNPDILTWPFKGSGTRGLVLRDLNAASYVLSGKQGEGDEAWISRWLQAGGAEGAALVYNNGKFKIYKNR